MHPGWRPWSRAVWIDAVGGRALVCERSSDDPFESVGMARDERDDSRVRVLRSLLANPSHHLRRHVYWHRFRRPDPSQGFGDVQPLAVPIDGFAAKPGAFIRRGVHCATNLPEPGKEAHGASTNAGGRGPATAGSAGLPGRASSDRPRSCVQRGQAREMPARMAAMIATAGVGVMVDLVGLRTDERSLRETTECARTV
jgi:hypothetical protein